MLINLSSQTSIGQKLGIELWNVYAMHACIYIHTHTHTHTHIYIYIYIYIDEIKKYGNSWDTKVSYISAAVPY